MDGCPSPCFPRVRMVPVSSSGETLAEEMRGFQLAALAPLATVKFSQGRGPKVIATANRHMELPEFDPKNLAEWAEPRHSPAAAPSKP